MAYKEWIKELKSEFIGKRVFYDGSVYSIVNVDYNGIIHINKPTRYNTTTAVYEPHEARKVLVSD